MTRNRYKFKISTFVNSSGNKKEDLNKRLPEINISTVSMDVEMDQVPPPLDLTLLPDEPGYRGKTFSWNLWDSLSVDIIKSLKAVSDKSMNRFLLLRGFSPISTWIVSLKGSKLVISCIFCVLSTVLYIVKGNSFETNINENIKRIEKFGPFFF